MQSDHILDIKQFFFVAQQLVLQAGNYIKEAYESKDISVLRKPSGEAYTQYDLKIQKFYVTAFQKIWPKLKIIGEEDQDYDKPINFNYDSIDTTGALSSPVLEGLDQTYIDLNSNKVILWIDPIDGTSEFINGYMNNAVTLLGISINGKAKIGLIGRFYKEIGDREYEWNPKCYFSYADYPHVYVMDYLNENKIEEIVLKEKEQKGKLICAVLDFDAEEREKVGKFAEVYIFGGGESLTVAEGHSDFHVYRGAEYMKWDLCAGDAIISSLGGTTTDPFGKEFIYEEDAATFECPNGYLICRSKRVLEQVIELLNPKE